VKSFYVYIAASRSRVLYVGVTNHPLQRIGEHKAGLEGSFTARYRVDRLVYCEVCSNVGDAIRREKQIKGWTRARKTALIESANPEWEDLSRFL
jgi:putative endonuclease